MISFSSAASAMSHVLSASFVFNCGIFSLIAALVLPHFVPWIVGGYNKLEAKRKSDESGDSGESV